MIPSSYFWLNIFLLAVGTLCIRGSFIAISSKVNISERWRQVFSFIPSAILPAFVAPVVFFHQGQSVLFHGKERLAVVVAATLVCYLARSTLLTIFVGLSALYFIRFYQL